MGTSVSSSPSSSVARSVSLDRASEPPPNAPIDPRGGQSPARRLLSWTKVLFASVMRTRTLGLAAELAFWMFLSLIPLAAVLGLVVARFAMGDKQAFSSIMHAIPPSMRDLISTQLAKVSAWNGGTVAPLAALMFIWLASSGVHAVFDALELETESCQRPWWKKRLYALGTCVALSIGVAVLALLGTGLDWVGRLAGKSVSIGVGIHQAFALGLRMAIGACVAFGLVAGLYYVGLPKSGRRRMPLAPGAAVAVVLMALLGLGYGFYISQAGTGDAYQAGLAVIGITLMALYLLSMALLVGAEFNRVLGARRVLKFSVHTQVAPPPAVAKGMVKCEGDAPHGSAHRAPRMSTSPRPSRTPEDGTGHASSAR